MALWWKSDLAALLAASVLFGLYHFPYRYLGSGTGAAGEGLFASLLECVFNAIAGLVIGFVYWKSKKNLVAAVVLHAVFDAVAGMTMIHFGK